MTAMLISPETTGQRGKGTSGKRAQVAAICYRHCAQGTEVLLITSRDTGRWIVPKGWPIKGLEDSEAALQEAWEEAGVKEADIGSDPVGHFEYIKDLDEGGFAEVEAQVYMAEVHRLERDYPECGERERKWVSSRKAAEMVQESGLQEILRDL